MPTRQEIEAKWSELDPIFIMGPRRSGTSVMARTMTLLGFAHFGEGHLWLELMRPLARLRDQAYRARLRRPEFALGEERNLILEKYVALALDRFHRDHLPGGSITRWSDKSPGREAVRAAPMLAKAFPKSQFIFIYRSGIETVHSGLQLWSDQPGIFHRLCTAWIKVMSSWRQVRGELGDRYIEIRQEELATNPEDVAAQLTAFLGVPERREDIAEMFCTKRVNTAFPDKSPGDYAYDLDWSDQQKLFFIEKCAEEMEIWGYTIPFTLDPPWMRRWKKAWHTLRTGGVQEMWAETAQYFKWRLDE